MSFFEEYAKLLNPNQNLSNSYDFYGSPLKSLGVEEKDFYQVNPNWMSYRNKAITLGDVAIMLPKSNFFDVKGFLSKSATIIFHEALLKIYSHGSRNNDFFDGIYTFFQAHKKSSNNDFVSSELYKIFIDVSSALLWLSIKDKNKDKKFQSSLNNKSFKVETEENEDITESFLSKYQTNIFQSYKTVFEVNLKRNLEWYLSKVPDQLYNHSFRMSNFYFVSMSKGLSKKWSIEYTELPFNKLFYKIDNKKSTLQGSGGKLDFSSAKPFLIDPDYRPIKPSLVLKTLLLIDLHEYWKNNVGKITLNPLNMNNQISDDTLSIAIPTTVPKIVNSCYPASSRLFNSNFKPSDNTAIPNTDENALEDIFSMFDTEYSDELEILEDGDLKLTIPKDILNIVKDEKGEFCEFLCFDLYVYYFQNVNEEPIYVPSEIIDEDFFPDENQVVVTINLEANSDGSVELENGIRFSPKSTKVRGAFDRSDEHDGYVVVICFFVE